MPTINQETGEAGVEPTETLSKFRSDLILRPGSNRKGKVTLIGRYCNRKRKREERESVCETERKCE